MPTTRLPPDSAVEAEKLTSRAAPSGRRLSAADASLVKGMLARGDRQHDIAAWFGVNSGRIIDVKNRTLHPDAPIARKADLPPPGPYSSGRAAHQALAALKIAKAAIDAALREIRKEENATKAEQPMLPLADDHALPSRSSAQRKTKTAPRRLHAARPRGGPRSSAVGNGARRMTDAPRAETRSR